jgi:hypothetical protein
MHGEQLEMAMRPLTLKPVLKLLQATPATLKWRMRMRGEVATCILATWASTLTLPGRLQKPGIPLGGVLPALFQSEILF